MLFSLLIRIVPEDEVDLAEQERQNMEPGIKSVPTQEAMEREAGRIEAERAMADEAMEWGICRRIRRSWRKTAERHSSPRHRRAMRR